MSSQDDDHFVMSSDEGEDQISLSAARRFKMRFGQHVGETVGALSKSHDDREYLRFLLRWPPLRNDARIAIQRVLEADGPDEYDDAREFTLKFGQYRGATLGQVAMYSDGRAYLRYLLDWPELRDNTKVAIQCVLDNYDTRRGR